MDGLILFLGSGSVLFAICLACIFRLDWFLKSPTAISDSLRDRIKRRATRAGIIVAVQLAIVIAILAHLIFSRAF